MLHPPFIYTPWKKVVLESFKLSLSHLGLICQELVRQDWNCDYQECQWGKESSNTLHLNKQNTVLKAISAGASFIPFHLKSLGFSVWAPPKERAQPWFASGGDLYLSWAKGSHSCGFFSFKLMCIMSQAVCRCPVVIVSYRYLAKNLQNKQTWEKPGHHTSLHRYLTSHLISVGKSDVKSLFSPVSLQPLTRNWVCQECQGIKRRTQRCY